VKPGLGDTGGPSRFFPVFRYEPKADTAERPRHEDTAHPTVKPLDLMRWLVRLVTPRGGIVLDPFAGSGTTGEACILEGFQCVLIEREPAYMPLIEHRLEHAWRRARARSGGPKPPPAAPPVAGQLGLFEAGA
jgi:site-specific DNA-methyltransferase (adenine-specific)